MRCIVCDLCDLVTEDVDHKFFVNLEFWFVVDDEIGPISSVKTITYQLS